jgi:hypothetical protein
VVTATLPAARHLQDTINLNGNYLTTVPRLTDATNNIPSGLNIPTSAH